MRQVGSANEHLKGRWYDVVRWSMVAAAASHVAVFSAWPAAEVRVPAPDPRHVGMQALAFATVPLPADLLQAPATTQPEPEPVENASEVETPNDIVNSEAVATFEGPVPSIAATRLASWNPDARRIAVDTRTLSGPSIRVAPSPDRARSTFTWPDIRNPREMIRYFRLTYNPLHTGQIPNSQVDIAIWLNEMGRVERAEVQESSGRSEVDRIALAAVHEVLEFTPARSRGVPVAVAVVISFPFEVRW